MTPPRTITIREGGSGAGFGQTFWRRFVYGCSRRALLDLAHRGTGDRRIEGATGIGTLFHALNEEHDRKLLPDDLTAIRFRSETGAEISPEAELEALRLFAWYRPQRLPGKVIAVEREIPRNAAEAKRVAAVLPFPSFSARLDRIMDLDQRACDWITDNRGEVITPGLWIVDYKTAASCGPGDLEVYRADLQGRIYAMALAAAEPKRLVKGVLYEVITKTATPRAALVVVPFPSPAEQRMIDLWASRATQLCAAAGWQPGDEINPLIVGSAPANPDRCLDWKRRCEWLDIECNRV